MTLIFGEDGKEISEDKKSSKGGRGGKGSVYDLEPDADEFSGKGDTSRGLNPRSQASRLAA